MVNCPTCDAPIDADEEDLDEGDSLTCEECGANLSVSSLDPLELEIVYLKTGRRVTVPAGEDLLAEARRAGHEAAAGIRAGHFEARPQPRRCQLCAYRLACPDAL